MRPHKGRICPKIEEILVKIMIDARSRTFVYADEGQYEVTYMDETIVVDLVKCTCNCRV